MASFAEPEPFFCWSEARAGVGAAFFKAQNDKLYCGAGADWSRLFCLDPEPTQVGRSRNRLRDIGLTEPRPPKKVAAPQHWLWLTLTRAPTFSNLFNTKSIIKTVSHLVFKTFD